MSIRIHTAQGYTREEVTGYLGAAVEMMFTYKLGEPERAAALPVLLNLLAYKTFVPEVPQTVGLPPALLARH